ncbi:hypothetical protein B0T25DRAFT_617195 [Lasiosphaeria hispida]|uniref:Uncharacterized protein n=1 Tax=Lasiosphaeria hispida TaxID=260671 RepID=A0AAJ0H7H1_9PEZI|nr:hypothetical protein B0T25DRAFT_617195 [Lasiosphaeria hispida]
MGDGGRDCITMQILLRFHEGADNKMMPTWFPIVEEKPPVLCLTSQLLAKALAEGVIDTDKAFYYEGDPVLIYYKSDVKYQVLAYIDRHETFLINWRVFGSSVDL